MMNTVNQSSSRARAYRSVLRYGTVLVLASGLVAAQGRIKKPQSQTNSSGSGKRQHVATLRSSDSSEGSRVAVTSDQSLSNYEAYRRGDHFYVKIPAAEVPRAETTRGRGYADVKAQRSGDSTVVSFRLQPGATAHVEQRSNKLEVVFTVPGAHPPASAAVTGRQSTRSNNRSSAQSAATKKPDSSKPNTSAPASTKGSAAAASKNSNDRASTLTARGSGSLPSATPAQNSNGTSASKASATPSPTPRPSPTAKAPAPTLTPATSSAASASPTSQSASPISQSTTTTPAQPQRSAWSNFRERLQYWILLAQLNPIPVAVGAAVLLLLLGLLVLQRRRAKTTRRVRPSRSETAKATAAVTAASSVAPLAAAQQPAPVTTPNMSEAPVAAAVVAAAPLVAAAARRTEPEEEAVSSTPADSARHERVNRVSEEVKKLMSGGDYDRGVVASDDPETRQLVGAELLSALVGRNAQRRESARAAFMEHGYFDDATRDLRVAESANERAAAARRLSFVHDHEATPHLIMALEDSAPDVRRAAVEALMDLRDPAAIGPLNSLMQTEKDRKVPLTLIKHAIESCATSGGANAPVAPPVYTGPPTPEPSSHPSEPEREVIEL